MRHILFLFGGGVFGFCLATTIKHYTGYYDSDRAQRYQWSVYSVCPNHKHLVYCDTVTSLKGIDLRDTSHNEIKILE